MGDELPGQIAPGQGEIAKQVQRLVPHAFVLESQLVFDDSVWPEHEQVLIADALPQPPLA